MANEIATSSVTAEELMEQAQTYASTWASVGGPFDDGNTLARAEEEKDKFWSLVEQLVQERDDYRTAEEHQIALRKKDQARINELECQVEEAGRYLRDTVRRDAQIQADILSECIGKLTSEAWEAHRNGNHYSAAMASSLLLRKFRELRQQAKGSNAQ